MRWGALRSTLLDAVARPEDIMEMTEDISFWKAVARFSPDCLIVVNEAGTILFCSDLVQSLLGWKPEELAGKPVETLLPAPMRASHQGMRKSYHSKPSPRLMGAGRELSALAKNGKPVEIEIALNPLPLPGGLLVLAALRPPSPQRRLEKAIQAIFKATATSVGVDYISALVSSLGATTGVDRAFLAVADAGVRGRLKALACWQGGNFIETAEYSILGTPCERVFTGEDVVILQRLPELFPRDNSAVHAGMQAYIGVPLRAASGAILGNLVLLNESALPNGAELVPTLKLFAMRAASELERIKIETELNQSLKRSFQSEKLTAIGQLAAGVAHEINNPLGVILGFAQSLAKRLKAGDPFALPIQSIEREALRCKALASNLLAFSRESGTGPRIVALDEAMQSSLLLVEAQARVRSVAIRREGGLSGLSIRGDSIQIQQVIINLCSNAIDAMPKGGTITVGACVREDMPGFVAIRVEDTGVGIPENVRLKMFEPFFTTKAAGKGTGLGLALVAEITARLGGSVECDSIMGKGTVFRVNLPAAS